MIIDTSSLINLITTGKIEKTFDQKILDLTLYEAGNVIWKMHNLQERISHEEMQKMIKILDKLEKELEVIKPERQKTIEIATELDITFYDASYIAACLQEEESLITEDKELRKKAEEKGLEVLKSDRID